MCGRFTLSANLGTFMDEFHLHAGIPDYSPRYNIAPGQNILVITEGPGARELSQMRWGLIPHWAKDKKIGYKMINARSETIDQKPAFKNSFLHRRCLIPADGFYEWKKTGGGKQPLHIVLPGKTVFAFAGIWDYWKSFEDTGIFSCSIITTEANEDIQDIHDRMPVMLAGEREYSTWLSVDEPALLKELLKPYQGVIKAYPVSTMVNSPKVDNRQLIEEFV